LRKLNRLAKEKTPSPKEDEHITQEKPKRGTMALVEERKPSSSSLFSFV